MAILRYTNAGLAELISAKNEGLMGAITHVAAGTEKYTPSHQQTQLRNEKQRVLVADYEDLGATQIRLAARFDGDLEYEVGEVGFYLSTGTLLAVYSAPGETLTYKSAYSHWLQRFTLDLTPLPSESVTVNVGVPNVNLLMASELATVGAATISNMARQTDLLFRVMELEKQR